VTGDKAAVPGKCCFFLAAAEAGMFKDSQVSPIDSYLRDVLLTCIWKVRWELGEDPGPHLLIAAGQRRTLLRVGSCSVSYEMLQSRQTATQVTIDVFQS